MMMALHIEINGTKEVLNVDHVVVCAGQNSNRELFDQLKESGHQDVHLIGGAKEVREIDAKRAIRDGVIIGQKI